jgi:hypothetical protein
MKHASLFWFQLLLGVVLIGARVSTQAQDPTLTKLRQQVETQAMQSLSEKLFVHTDRQFYIAGEVMWFRLFYVDGILHQPLDVSKVAYLELLDKDQKSVLQTKVGLGTGKGSGSLLLPLTLTSGHYVVRAYTAWMKNTGPDFLFEKPITIVNSFRKLGLPASNDSLAYDAQFFPEGGHLVNGLPAKIAFKVVDRKTGRGVDCQGFLLNRNDTVARFTSLKFGMGSFSFTPTSGTPYRVVLTDRRSRTITGSLPAIDEQGYTLRVDEGETGQLKVTARTNKPAPDSQNPVVYLVGHTRQSVKVAQVHSVHTGETTFLIPKNSLGEGISHFTLFDGAGKPVCERLYFKRPQPGLAIQIQPDKPQYASRTPVTLNLATTDPTGRPLDADLSVSVFRLDSLQTANESLPGYIWLTSDLRGAVESPDYYLTQTGPEADAAVDNLMLTQGWRRFRWETERAAKSSTVEAVPEHRSLAIQGRVINKQTGAPVPQILTYLSVPGAVSQLQSIRSDEQGRVRFEMDNFYGAKDVVLQVASADSTFRIDVSSPFTDASANTPLPIFTLSEPDRSALMERSLSMQVQTSYASHNVSVPQLPQLIDTTAFYGKADERYLLDAYTRFTVMEEVLSEYVPGVQVHRRNKHFSLRVYNVRYREFFEGEPLILLDGVPIVDTDRLMAFSPLKIRSLDVVTKRYFLGYSMLPGIVSFKTYKGDLAGFQLDPHSVVLEYDGLQAQREFAAPQYSNAAQLESRVPDFRNLLYWNPQVRTGAQGKSALSFYTCDQEGTYRVVVQGMTTDGCFNWSQQTFVVQPVVK